MDTQITTWEMNLESSAVNDTREEIAAGPLEPYKLDWDAINWN
ncbi:hypothetical protein [Flavisolibacter ginsengisoli]|jgi:hypothetical protein|uniref:Uncharacterized protein n=1 Tax=Flavisolibacter ginsengisoli DSM 18119 TaxID=1121884 RepID=A0A1M5C9W4_9BACT|nr:hypothetical protein [Flavisolibacter ginsengisoli]SHF51397.1 hypothetical protein SAMN02745131_02829 [Flavisolibacter ginsengisoli DSM 18119]